MNKQIAQNLLAEVMGWSTQDDNEHRPYLQLIARYKYDKYNQYSTGKRFIEQLALWLKQFNTKEERREALRFVEDELIFVSREEMNSLVRNAYPDLIKKIIIQEVANDLGISKYQLNKIISNLRYKELTRKSLFLGLSDGAHTGEFRRFNSVDLTHEQIYQTYEVSSDRAKKMKSELADDLTTITGKKPTEAHFSQLFLLDDFSASGKSYIRESSDGKFKGKISSIYTQLEDDSSALNTLVDRYNIKIFVILYLCTQQSLDQIKKCIDDLWNKEFNKPQVFPVYLIDSNVQLSKPEDSGIIKLCENDDYYDADKLEDEHTKKGGGDVKLGFGECRLPLILNHNTPNNTISLLWAYDKENIKFKGLFPRVPRHRG